MIRTLGYVALVVGIGVIGFFGPDPADGRRRELVSRNPR